MKSQFILLGALIMGSTVFISCKKEVAKVVEVIESPKPLADFTYELASAADLKTFKFKSTSATYSNLLWQFGDDSISALDNLVHTYQFYGKYKVVLTARNKEGYWARKEVILNLINPAFDSARVGENYIQTVGGILTVSKDNSGGPGANEGSLKLIDGSIDSKFLFEYPSTGEQTFKFQFQTPKIAEAYTLVSGDDAPSRDLKSWTFEASDNDIDWKILNTQKEVLWTLPDGDTQRKAKKIFHFNNAVAYKFYRLLITQNNGSNLLQIAEWSINKSQP